MAPEGYEEIDLDKKQLVEEILAEERDDAIIKVAKMRKRQPPKLRSKARNIASNVAHYYSKVCVDVGASTELFNLSGSLTDDDRCDRYIPQNLTVLTKVLTECLDERKKLMKVQRQLLSNLGASDSKSEKKGKRRYPFIIAPHMYSADFIADESMV